MRRRRLWDPMQLLMLATGWDRRRAEDTGFRWTRAFRGDPELVTDILQIGRVLGTRPVRFENGVEMADPIDPIRLAYEAGQQDMARRLLALGGISRTELRNLMETDQDV